MNTLSTILLLLLGYLMVRKPAPEQATGSPNQPMTAGPRITVEPTVEVTPIKVLTPGVRLQTETVTERPRPARTTLTLGPDGKIISVEGGAPALDTARTTPTAAPGTKMQVESTPVRAPTDE